MTTTESFAAGDVVRHLRRPEWGPGAIQRVESIPGGRGASSRNDQRLWIRFPNAGLKTLLASVAELERVSRADGGLVENDATLASREMNGETGWLAQISKKKPADAMSEIPAQASDPFIPPNKRLEFVLGLYRFDTQRNLIDWAIAQSGLGDPLTRFSRHELEEQFRLWSMDRDAALGKLLADPELRGMPDYVKATLAKALPSARQAARRVMAFR